ncbi:large terminase subunit [Caulobacter phage RW]|nr:large terminase subunit [Caulobacter phage RW]
MIHALPHDEQVALLAKLKWRMTARPNQLPPAEPWSEWGLQAGRGFGKTLVGSNWLWEAAWDDPLRLPSAVIAPTQSDVRYTCFEGVSGLLANIPPELIKDYNKSDLILTLVNGAIIRGFSAEKPDRLRGPQFARVWCDEVAAWQNATDTWDMFKFGLRLGPKPQVCWTSTPKPTELVRKLVAPAEGRIIVRGSSYDNRANLSADFFKQLEQFEGTQLGRQEIHGELIDPEEAGIIKRSWFRMWPNDKPLPSFDFVLMSLDTAFTEATLDKKGNADYSACTVWGVFRYENKTQVILLDCWQEQLGLPDLVARVKKELNIAYGEDEQEALIKPMFGSAKLASVGRKPDMCLIEDKGSGISLRQTLEREGIMAYAYNPGRADKLARLHMVSHVFARKQVWLVESAIRPGQPRKWAEDLLAQLCAFTGSGSIKHDDLVDSTTQAMRLLLDKGLMVMVEQERARIRTAIKEDVAVKKPVSNPYAV